jgi:hypothetical protein
LFLLLRLRSRDTSPIARRRRPGLARGCAETEQSRPECDMFRCVAAVLLLTSSAAVAAQSSRTLHVGMTITAPVPRSATVGTGAAVSLPVPLPRPRPRQPN